MGSQQPCASEPSSGESSNMVRNAESSTVEELAAAWQSLPSTSPMQEYIWARSCAEAFPSGTLQLITVGADPRAIAVLVQQKNSALLKPLGAELYEPVEFPYADAGAAEKLAEAMARLPHRLFLHDVLADSILVDCLRRACGARLVIRPIHGHPWLELDDTWLEPESHLNSGRRSDLRRARRQAEKLGPVRCEMIAPDPHSLEPLLEEAFRVEAASWKGRQGSALAMDPQVGLFYRRYAHAACERQTLRLGLLSIGERAVAMQLGIELADSFWLFKMGFDEEFSRCSPGALMMIESLRCARLRGCSRYEFTGKREKWNQIWTQESHPAVALNIHPPGIRGGTTLAIDWTRAAIVSRLRGLKG